MIYPVGANLEISTCDFEVKSARQVGLSPAILCWSLGHIRSSSSSGFPKAFDAGFPDRSRSLDNAVGVHRRHSWVDSYGAHDRKTCTRQSLVPLTVNAYQTPLRPAADRIDREPPEPLFLLQSRMTLFFGLAVQNCVVIAPPEPQFRHSVLPGQTQIGAVWPFVTADGVLGFSDVGPSAAPRFPTVPNAFPRTTMGQRMPLSAHPSPSHASFIPNFIPFSVS